MSRELSSRALRLRAVFRVTIVLGALLIAVLETIGFPGWVTELVTARMSNGAFVVKATGMRLDLLSGIYMEDVKIFRKKVIGPAAVNCQGMRVRINLFSGFSSGGSRYSVEFLNGEIIPAQATGEVSGECGEMPGLDVTLTGVTINDILLKRMSAVVSSCGSSVSVTNIVCSLGGDYMGGAASGWVNFEGKTDTASGRVITAFDPHKLRPFLQSIDWQYPSELIDRFVWNGAAPLVDTSFEIVGKDESRSFSGRSLFSMTDYTYRGVSNDTCDGVVTILCSPTNEVVCVDHITIGIGDGAIVGGFSYDDRAGCVSYRAAVDVDPKDFFQMVNLFDREAMKDWHFDGVTRFISEGVVDFDGWEKTAIKAEVDSAGIGVGPLVADRCRFNVIMTGPTCRLTDVHGSIYGGDFNARVQMTFGGEKKWQVNFGCELKDCEANQVVHALGASVSDNMSGKFNLEMDGSFLLATNLLDTITARGCMSIADGRVFQLPLFGGLTRILTKIVPGLDFLLSQSNMEADFDVADGTVASDKIAIDGGVLSMTAKGTATFEGDLDYSVQLTLLKEHTVVSKLIRAVTWPISKLMEFRLKGPADAPEWYPVNFSMDLLERIGLKKAEPNDEN